MTPKPVILVFGRDADLLQTRRWVLEQAGYQVLTAHTLAQAENTLAVQSIDLFLLCHSTSMEDCKQLLTAANTTRPEIKLLLMAADMPLCSLSRNERVISAFQGPQALIDAVHQLCAHNPTTGESDPSFASQGSSGRIAPSRQPVPDCEQVARQQIAGSQS